MIILRTACLSAPLVLANRILPTRMQSKLHSLMAHGAKERLVDEACTKSHVRGVDLSAYSGARPTLMIPRNIERSEPGLRIVIGTRTTFGGT